LFNSKRVSGDARLLYPFRKTRLVASPRFGPFFIPMSERKVFKMYLSYFEVAEELNDKDRLKFYDAIMKRQFFGEEPNFTGMLKLAWVSQKHSIDKQIEGFETKTGVKLTPMQDPSEDPRQGGAEGSKQDPRQQLELQVEEKEQVQLKEKEKLARETLTYPFEDDLFIDWWGKWKLYKKQEHRFTYKSQMSEQGALMDLQKKSDGDLITAIEIIKQSIAQGYKGLFELKRSNNGQGQQSILGLTKEQQFDLARNKDI